MDDGWRTTEDGIPDFREQIPDFREQIPENGCLMFLEPGILPVESGIRSVESEICLLESLSSFAIGHPSSTPCLPYMISFLSAKMEPGPARLARGLQSWLAAT
jgi:hypothetical protein